MHALADAMALTPSTTVLDIGGTAGNWSLLDLRPRVTLLNLVAGDVHADGTKLPFRDDSFDIAFSNSTIEHVGDLAAQREFAHEVSRISRAYFVQTPNRYFPVEPHYMTPLVQFLPRGLFRRVARNFTVWGLITRPDAATIDAAVRSIDLITPSRMRALFPDAEIRTERWLGLAKSLIAVRRAGKRNDPVAAGIGRA